MLVGCWVIYDKIIKNQDLAEMWDSVKLSFSSWKNIILMVLALLLMPLNLSFEALKWKKSLLPVESVTFKRAYISVFTGITAGMLFPNRTGDFLGRIFILEKGNRIKAAMLTFVGYIAQMIVTVSLGCVAWLFFTEGNAFWYTMVISLIIISIALLFYFNIGFLVYLNRIIPRKWRDRTRKYMDIFNSFSRRDLLQILLLAVAKYAVYSFQFVLLLWAFEVPLSYLNAMVPIMMTYLLMMVIPFITITEIAVRGGVCISVFDKWLTILGIGSSYSMMVFSASTMLWLYNLAIPAIIGLFFIRKLKFMRRSYES